LARIGIRIARWRGITGAAVFDDGRCVVASVRRRSAGGGVGLVGDLDPEATAASSDDDAEQEPMSSQRMPS